MGGAAQRTSGQTMTTSLQYLFHAASLAEQVVWFSTVFEHRMQ